MSLSNQEQMRALRQEHQVQLAELDAERAVRLNEAACQLAVTLASLRDEHDVYSPNLLRNRRYIDNEPSSALTEEEAVLLPEARAIVDRIAEALDITRRVITAEPPRLTRGTRVEPRAGRIPS